MRYAALLLSIGLLAGCRMLDGPVELTGTGSGGTLNLPIDHRVVMEIYFVRIPDFQSPLTDSIWQEVDELQFPPELRRDLARHGFRAGLIGTQLPKQLDEILSTVGSTATSAEVDAESTGSRPTTSKQRMHLRSGRPGKIVPLARRERLTVMTLDEGELIGNTYRNAQGVLTMRCRPQGDGRVEVRLLPEIQHGEMKRRIIGDQGIFRQEVSQERVVFESLQMAATMTAGQTLVVGSLDYPSRSLGREFFTDRSSGQPVRKLMLIRLVESSYDDSLEGSLNRAISETAP